MIVYIIYEKAKYKEIPLAKKILFNAKDEYISDSIKGYTEYKNVAKAYVDVTPNTYMKKYIVSDRAYDLLSITNPNKKIQCYTIARTNELILLSTEDKLDRAKKGVEFYDYP